uniref:ABC transporter domain-containing protein n=1 Tax=Amorphochlora amoebiformis TaxID=1561963 RepID=A0A7S0DPK3_9EUKA|mmetsp:Transcript_4967/g.7550  ORF Transcript_4967/g.7550 Transcript_4967/m.7550 type:complete len:846 (+) Transcript_4967:73-2610(+)
MQAISNSLISAGKDAVKGSASWPPPVKTVLRQGVLLCIAVGLPIGALLYDSQMKGKSAQNAKERHRIAGIIRSMLIQDKKDHVACQRLWTAVRDAKEVGTGDERVQPWREELGKRIASTLALAVEGNDSEAVATLTNLMEKEPLSTKYIPEPLRRRLHTIQTEAFRKKLRTVLTLVIGPARAQLKWILLNIFVGISQGIVRSIKLTYYLKAADAARVGRGGVELLEGLLATLVVYVLECLLDVLQKQCANRGAGEISVQLQRRLFARLLTADCSFHEIQYKLADKVYLLREAATLDQKLLRLPIDLASTVASLGARYYALGKMSTRLLVACGLFVPISSWLSTKAELWSTQQREALRHRVECRRSTDSRILGNQLLTVRSFVQERIEAEHFERFLRYKIREESKATVLSAIASLAQLLPLMGRLGALLYGSQLVSKGWMTAIQLEEFVTAHDIATSELNSLKSMVPSLWAAMEPAARIVEVLNTSSSIERGLNEDIQLPPWAQKDKKGEYQPFSVEFKDVWFSYPSRPNTPVLRGVSFMIKAGAKVAVVGSSGSGKSTVLALIQRFYEIDKGTILIDGRDIREYDPRWLRKLVAVVSQRCVMFPRDVISNISLGSHHSGDQGEELKGDEEVSEPHSIPTSIENAAKTAYAAKFIEKLPEGYHTQLGEGGVGLSGGQQQRIAIARAIEKRPSLLLLDEAFANLDASSEASVLQALKALVEARPQTIVTVAHQLSTIAWSDSIICMDQGVVKEIGTHSQLMKRNGIYKQMYVKQTASQKGNRRRGLSLSSIPGSRGRFDLKTQTVSKNDDAVPEEDLAKLPDLKLLRAFTLPVLRRSRSDVLSLCGN